MYFLPYFRPTHRFSQMATFKFDIMCFRKRDEKRYAEGEKRKMESVQGRYHDVIEQTRRQWIFVDWLLFKKI